MPTYGKHNLTIPAFCLLVILWSSNFSVVKIGLAHAPPILFGGLRSVIGGLLVALAALVWGGSPRLRRDWPVFAILSVLNVILFFGLQTLAINYLPSGTAAVLIYLQPILTGLFAWPVLGETLSASKVAGLILGFSGIVAVSSGSFTGKVSTVGVVFAVTGALSWALGTVYFKKVQDRVSTLWAVALPFLFGGILLTLIGALVEPVSEISWNGTFLESLIYVSISGTALAWLLWLALVRAGEASRVAAYVFAVPITAVLLGIVFLGEPLGFPLLIGAVLVVAGIYLVNRTPPREA